MDDRLFLLIEKYRSAVAECMRVMRHCAHGSDTWKGDLRPSGEFPEHGIDRYYFHGRGLCIKRGDIVIDWDFDMYANGDYIIGFDPYFMSQFAQTSMYPEVEYWDGDEIKEQLIAWQNVGLAHPPRTFEMSNLWYLERDVHKLKLNKFKDVE